MNLKTSVAILLCIQMTALIRASAQEIKAVASCEVLPVVAVQEDSPLKIERFAIRSGVDKKYFMVYSVRNTSPRDIVSYRIMRSFDTGTGFLEYGAMPTAKVLRPGESYGNLEQLTTLNDQQACERKMKAIAVIMIAEVTFADGRTFSAEKLVRAVEDRLSEYRLR